jgi:hypothetical protein
MHAEDPALDEYDPLAQEMQLDDDTAPHAVR